MNINEKFSSVQSFSHVQLFASSWTAALQASLSITNSRSPSKLMSIESVMPSNHLILCRPLLPLPSIFPSIRGFSNESVLHNRCPKYWSFSFSISPSNEHPGLISFRMDWLDLAVQRTQESSPTPQFKSINSGGGGKDGGGIGREDHFLPHKFLKRTFQRRANSTKQLL